MKVPIRLSIALMAIAMLAVVAPRNAAADDQKSDAQILGVVMAADKSEIEAAKLTKTKNVNPDVFGYAELMQGEHSADLTEYEALAKKMGVNADDKAGDEVKSKSDKLLDILKPLEGRDYDRAYIDAMVKDHSEDLEMVDKDLLADVHDQDLKAQLQRTRQHMATHLERAKEIQAKLGKS